MCGRLACTLCPDDIVEAVHNQTSKTNPQDDEPKTDETKSNKPQWIERQYTYKPTFNGAPTTVFPVMVHKSTLGIKIEENLKDSDNNTSEYCIIPMQWSMILPNKPESSYHTHNARLENVLNSGLYKPCLFSGKRCVILADGYYEWKTTQGKDYKVPYYLHFKQFAFRLQGNHLQALVLLPPLESLMLEASTEVATTVPEDCYLAIEMRNCCRKTKTAVEKNQEMKNLVKFAGLFNTIQDSSGIKHTCSMLTKESTTSLSWLHHRMPIFLNTPDDIHNWLNSKDVKYQEALNLLPDYEQVASEYKLEYYQVDKSYVNNSSCNSEKCMERLSLKRKGNTLDGWLSKKKK